MKFEKLMDSFEQRYPNQGLNRGTKPEYEQVLGMWITILEKAKEGKFDDIRPDILVQFFPKFKAIHEHYCNFKHG